MRFVSSDQGPEDEPVLPETTSDEHPEGWGDRAPEDDPEDLDRFLRERPRTTATSPAGLVHPEQTGRVRRWARRRGG